MSRIDKNSMQRAVWNDVKSALENVGTVVSKTGLTVEEQGFGDFKTTIFTFANMAVTMADNAGVTAYGSQQLYDFPQGYVYIQGACANIALTKSSAGVNDTWDGDVGVGTAAANNTATPLATTEQNIIPNTATPQAVAGVTTANGQSTATEHAIIDGHTTAADLYINFLVDDADHDVTTTPCNLILNGTLRVNWLYMGDN